MVLYSSFILSFSARSSENPPPPLLLAHGLFRRDEGQEHEGKWQQPSKEKHLAICQGRPCVPRLLVDQPPAQE